MRKNEFGQPIGDALPDWRGAVAPGRIPVDGRFCRIEPLDAERHVKHLFDAFAEDTDGKVWTYMSVGPFDSVDAMREWVEEISASDDPLFYAVVDAPTGQAIGVAAYLRIKPEIGVIEIGHIAYAPRLQKTPAATEAMYLLMRRVFSELGYRRYEWKCDALNEASRIAAERLGFSFDGVFEQALVYKGRNRDTAWYSILDSEWPALDGAFGAWLEPANFGENGRQRKSLRDFVQEERQS